MPEIEIEIGGRTFEVACQEGEEHYLKFAAKMLDEEASVLASQIGRIPEARMLLMAGLMLADKTAGTEEQQKQAEARIAELEAEVERLRAGSGPVAAPEPERIEVRVEVPVAPEGLEEDLEALASRAEYIAAKVAEKTAQGGAGGDFS